MNIVFFGHNGRGIQILKTLAQSRHNVSLACGLPSSGGWFESIEDAAINCGVEYQEVLKPNDEDFLVKIKNLHPDLIIMCGYSKIVGEKLRSIPSKGIVNLHASMLPEYRGAAPLNWAIINGEKKHGLSIYFVDGGIDTGPVLLQESFDIGKNETIADILPKTLDLYSKMILQACEMIEESDYELKHQDLDNGSYFPKRKPEDGLLKWSELSNVDAYNLVRALTKPYPGAFFIYEGKKIFVWKARAIDCEFAQEPGTLFRDKNANVCVVTKDKGLMLDTIQEESQHVMSARDYFGEIK